MKSIKISFLMLLLIFIYPIPSMNASTVENFNILSMPGTKIPYISLIELGERYNIFISYDTSLFKMTLKRGNVTLNVTNNSNIAVLNGKPENLVFPCHLINGTIFVPVQTFLPLFSTLVNGTLEWNEKNKEIEYYGSLYTIKKVSFENREGGTLIRISLEEPLLYTDGLSENGWLHIKFADGSYDPINIYSNTPTGIIQETLYFQREGEARLSFKVSEEMESYSISKTSDNSELLVSLRYARTGTNAESTSNSTPDVPVIKVPEAPFSPVIPVNKELWTIDTVIIDPGHGGKDSGAVGPSGLKEKDIVLSVSKELKKICDEQGEIKVVLTRDRDVFVPLQERARRANRNSGKLFVSIHANAHTDKSANGIEIFFLSTAKTEAAQKVAERENASIRLEDNPGYYTQSGTFGKILNGMRSNVYLKESQDICKIMLDKAVSATKLENRGVKQAGFYVMVGTLPIMPSVLFEIGFISNPKEEKVLNRISYQKRIAQSIYDSIIEFKRQVEKDLISAGD